MAETRPRHLGPNGTDRRAEAEPKRAGIYVRVSTDIQTDNTSLGDQEQKCRNWCESHNYAVPQVYREEGVSGAKGEERQSLQALLADAEAGKIDIVVCSHLDRFARSLHVLLETVDRLRRCGVPFVCAQQNIDTSDERFGTVFLQLLGVFAEWERTIIAERTKSGKICEVQKGKYIGGQMPFGFENARDGTVVINEQEAEIVRHIFDLAKNHGTLAVARLLNEKQIPHYRTRLTFPNRSRHCKRYDRRRNSRYCKVSRAWLDFNICEECLKENGGQPLVTVAWSVSIVRKILHNRKYIGEVEWGPKKGPKAKGHNPAFCLIPPDQFEQVQRRMEQFAQEPSRARSSGHLLTGGILKCFCGANFICLKKRDAFWYQCATRRNKKTCTQRMFRQDKLESEVIDAIQGFITEHNIDITGTISQTEQHKRRNQVEIDIQFFERALKNQEERLKQITEQAIACRQENRSAVLSLLEKEAGETHRLSVIAREALDSLHGGIKLEADQEYAEMLQDLTSSAGGGQLRAVMKYLPEDLRKNLLRSIVKEIVVDERGQLAFTWQNLAYITS